jgi:hypothetical protein
MARPGAKCGPCFRTKIEERESKKVAMMIICSKTWGVALPIHVWAIVVARKPFFAIAFFKEMGQNAARVELT